ncbi:MAG: hypothetical protein DMG11_12730 [Acidobacteria bacterium]|nr:MAG: hypothetical protein DMG11_12730 [Acidobacteriota bacterium]
MARSSILDDRSRHLCSAPPRLVAVQALGSSTGPGIRRWGGRQVIFTNYAAFSGDALYSAQILRQHGISRIALVTDARSMLRAAACFRKQGLTVVPAPFRFYNVDLTFEDLLPTWRAIESNGETFHELVGLLWYWFRGRI